MRRICPKLAVFIAITCASFSAAAADDVPAWLRQAAQAAVPAYSKGAPAIILVNDRKITVDNDGRTMTTQTFAVRILTRAGRSAALAREHYLTDSGKIREMRGWLIRPTGESKKYEKNQVLDVALANNDVYNESRVKAISAVDDADAGSVFGYEATSEDKSVFAQFQFAFQDRLPSREARFTVSLPAGWAAKGVTVNHEAVDPQISGSSFSWELRDLPAIDEEPAAPNLANLAPRIGVSIFPPPETKPGNAKIFVSWNQVANWLYELNEPQSIPNDAIKAKAQAITADATNEYQRLQAIAKYVQNVQYIAIQTGIGRGGGYRPHAATEVFSKSYGDCKDKVNLMRAMLKAIGIASYPVAIYSGDPTYVQENWPSPQQFNHAIIAVKVAAETSADTVINHDSFGRLLLFDPTDIDTPFGDLPDHEQDSLALLIASEHGDLLRMPTTAPEASRTERKILARLESTGALGATVRESTTGHDAVRMRQAFMGMPRTDFTKSIQAWIGRSVPGAVTTVSDPQSDQSTGRFMIAAEFTANQYGQLMNGRMLVFKPAIVIRRSIALTDTARKHPVVLTASSETITTSVSLPSGFVVDERPPDVHLETEFGKYLATYEINGSELTMTRTLILRSTIIPVEKYSDAREFFGRMSASETAPVVLLRK